MPLEGQYLGRYFLVRLLGSGGMGDVYIAMDSTVNRQVAIKVIRAEVSPFPDPDAGREAARLFQREVKAIAGLDHPHILPLYDYGEITLSGTTLTYMVMPYREEGTLATWLSQSGNYHSLSPITFASILQQAASALQYAHDRQIVHQDVKPSNFLIRKDEQNPHIPYLQLADFGVAKFTSTTTNASQSIRGTPAYMAPEQWEGNPVFATDQYALAIMAYELLTGRTPFQGGITQVMYQHLTVQPQPPGVYNPHIPADINEVVLHALAKKPESRFRTISAFANAFQQAVQSMDVPALLNMQSGVAPSTDKHAAQNKSNLNSASATLVISGDEALHGTIRTLSLSGGQRISVSIPAGTPNGHVIQLHGAGQDSSDGSQIGTILLTIAVTPDEQTVYSEPSNRDAQTFASTPPYNLKGNQVVSGIDKPRPRRSFGVTALLLIGLVLVVIVGSGIFFARASLGTGGGNSGSNTPVVAHTQVPTTQVPTTGITQPPATTDPYTGKGILAFDDPLVNNSQGHTWTEGTNQRGATCQFTAQGYHVTQPASGFFHSCTEQVNDYVNFVFEIQVTMLSGDYVGMFFRNNLTDSSYYLFRVDTAGHYYLDLYTAANPDGLILRQNTIAPVNFGQTYVLAVVANFENIDLYINHQKIDSVTDGTLTHGHLGVLVGNAGNAAAALFQNARVWTL
ncbi:MAG TPA: protein kinase [Ktedonobacteraceae bacterium]|nr:protein kinase [Ktedonobacteraceae bacterium]